MEAEPMCSVCNEPAIIGLSIINTREINGVQVGENYYYCSHECRFEEKRKFFTTAGIIIIIIGFIMMLSEILVGIFVIIIGFISISYAIILYPKSNEMYAAIQTDQTSYYQSEELAEMIQSAMENSEEMDDEIIIDGDVDLYPVEPARLNPKNSRQIYSDILEDYVGPCCYQTARLLDKYCMCGKAMTYISEN